MGLVTSYAYFVIILYFTLKTSVFFQVFLNYFRFGAISVTCVLQPSATGYALPLYRMQVVIQDMIVMLAKWRWYGDYTQVTFQTRGIKSMFHSITSAQFASNKCRVITVTYTAIM